MRHFSGSDYVAERDHEALANQIDRVRVTMGDQKWRSVASLQRRIQERYGITDPENSLQAQLRNLRKPEHGGFEVLRDRRTPNGERGYYVYKLGDRVAEPTVKHPTLSRKTKGELIALVLRLRRRLRKIEGS